MMGLVGDFKMELWEKKLREAIRTEIRGLVNEGKLDLAVLAENMQLDVSELLAEADEEAAKVVVDADSDGVHVEVTAGAEQAGDEKTEQHMDADGSMEQETEEIGGEEEEEEVMAADEGVHGEEDEGSYMTESRWSRLAGLIKG